MKDNLVTLRRVGVNSSDIGFFKELYVASFPPEERRPWPDMMSKMESEERFSFLGVYKGECPVGFITLWRLGPIVYCEHFAIDPALRGLGLGSEVIDAVVAGAECPIVLEVEPSGSTPEADRRIAFYSRHGLTECRGFNYIQPPYADGLGPVRLMLMVSADGVDLDEATGLIHSHVYGVGGN